MKLANRNRLTKLKLFGLQSSVEKLFDISLCSCNLPIVPCSDKDVKCSVPDCQKSHIVCKCHAERKVPLEDRLYLRDQRLKTGPKGSFQLGPVDRYAAKKMKRIHERHIEELPESPSRISTETDSSSTDHDNLSSDLEFNVETIPSGPYSLVKTPRFAAELIRAGISLRAGSAIFNAILSDLKDCGKHGLCSTPSGVILKSMTKFYNK